MIIANRQIKIFSFMVNFKVTNDFSIKNNIAVLIRDLNAKILNQKHCTAEKTGFRCDYCSYYNKCERHTDKKPEICCRFSCDSCSLSRECILPLIMSGKPEENSAGNRLHFYSIDFLSPYQVNFKKDEDFSFILNIQGSGIKYLRKLIWIFKNYGKKTITTNPVGKNMKLLNIINISDNETIFPAKRLITKKLLPITPEDYPEERFIIEFITRTRIQSNGSIVNKCVDKEVVNKALNSAFIKRGRMLLQRFHDVANPPETNENAIQVIDFNTRQLLPDQIEPGAIDKKRLFRNAISGKYLDGFVGKVAVQINDRQILPYIILLKYMHIGTNLSCGYGRFRIKDYYNNLSMEIRHEYLYD